MDLLSLTDWTRERIQEILASAVHIKQHPDDYIQALAGCILLMIFEKPSLRTREYLL
jgi:ornithine carbamoyltransferase